MALRFKSLSSVKRLILVFTALLSLVLPLAGPVLKANAAATITRQTEVIYVEANQGLLLKLDREAANVFIANPLIADIQLKSPKLFYVFGLLPGSTTLYAVDKNEEIIYSTTIEVTINIYRIQQTINKLIPSASIKVDSLSGIILLTGHAQSPDDADLAQQLVQEMLVISTVDGNVRQGLVQQKVINRIEISTPTQVNLRVKMAEMSRDVLKNLGFNWDIRTISESGASFFGFFQGSEFVNRVLDEDGVETLGLRTFDRGLGNSSVFNNIGGRHDVNGILDALENEGFISILAEPNITAISGETASFLAGGEFPIPVPQSGNSSGAITIVFKEFGVGLSFTPTVLSENKINLKVSPEVSQLTTVGAVTVDNITVPSLTTRRASTTVELGSGQSFAIAGLLQSNITQQANKFPWLGDIPILGTLFRSDSFKREETELVIIVTPYIVRPVSGEQLMAPTDINHLPMDAGRYIKGKRDLAGDGGLKTGGQ